MKKFTFWSIVTFYDSLLFSFLSIIGVTDMSSFITSSNTSQPVIFRDQDIADNQPPKSSYSINETLNFLILLVSYAPDYTWSLVAHVDVVMMYLEELLVQNRPGTSSRLAKIHFHLDKLCYWFNDCIHQYSHGPTASYIYHLMGLMNIRWMDMFSGMWVD